MTQFFYDHTNQLEEPHRSLKFGVVILDFFGDIRPHPRSNCYCPTGEMAARIIISNPGVSAWWGNFRRRIPAPIPGSHGKLMTNTQYYMLGKNNHILYVHDADKKNQTVLGSTRHRGDLSHSVFTIVDAGNEAYHIEGKNGHLLYVHDADKKDWTEIRSTTSPGDFSHHKFTIEKNHGSDTYRIFGKHRHNLYVHDADRKDWTVAGSTRHPGDLSHSDISFERVKQKTVVAGTNGILTDTEYYFEGKHGHLLYVDDMDNKDQTKVMSRKDPANISHHIFKFIDIGHG